MSEKITFRVIKTVVPSSRPDVLSERRFTLIAQEVGGMMSTLQEQQIRVCVNERPWWMPKPTWNWLLKLMLRREIEVRPNQPLGLV